MGKPFHHAGLGGTFDHFHAGHQALLAGAGAVAERISVGMVVNPSQSEKLWPASVQSLETRKTAVSRYLESLTIDAKVMELSDQAGTAASDESMDCLVVTADTLAGGRAVNTLRRKNGLSSLPLIEVPLVMADNGEPISSTRIRAGRIDRQGRVFQSVINSTIELSQSMKQQLRIPLGQVVDQPCCEQRLVVGDTTLQRFIDEGWDYDLAVIDGKKARQPYTPLVVKPSLMDLTLINPPSHLTTMLVEGLSTALRQQLQYVFVEGEEDIAALVLVLLAPLGWGVYYGQPDGGMVEWVVTEEQKRQALEIVKTPNLS